MTQLASGGQRETCRNNSSFSSMGPKDGTQVVRVLKDEHISIASCLHLLKPNVDSCFPE